MFHHSETLLQQFQVVFYVDARLARCQNCIYETKEGEKGVKKSKLTVEQNGFFPVPFFSSKSPSQACTFFFFFLVACFSCPNASQLFLSQVSDYSASATPSHEFRFISQTADNNYGRRISSTTAAEVAGIERERDRERELLLLTSIGSPLHYYLSRFFQILLHTYKLSSIACNWKDSTHTYTRARKRANKKKDFRRFLNGG